MDSDKATQQFLSYLSFADDASPHTIRAYRKDLTLFFQFANKEEVTKKLIRRYLAHLHENKASTRTILRRLSSLKSFYRHALKEKWVDSNPAEEIECPKREKRLPNNISY